MRPSSSAGRNNAARVRFCSTLAALIASLAFAAPAKAQVFETVGGRALGMGGAFVAVADDVTATYWNPAGLAVGGLVDAAVQRSTSTSPSNPDDTPASAGGWRASTTFLGFAIPSLGVSYLRTRSGQASSPTASPTDVRQQDRPGVASARVVAVDTFGVTLLQSLLPNLVVGTTLKLARGSSLATDVPGSTSLSTALDDVAQLPASARTRFDVDVGLMATTGPLRFGLVGRNLRQPDFAPDEATGAGRVARQVRAGIALTPGFTPGRTAASQPSFTIAFDADLTRATLPVGDERHVAAGVERWLRGRRVGVRAGVRASTVGDRRPVGTAGASVAVRPGILVEGHYARGRQAAGQQWSVGGRVTF
jgi:hypothetical protein